MCIMVHKQEALQAFSFHCWLLSTMNVWKADYYFMKGGLGVLPQKNLWKYAFVWWSFSHAVVNISLGLHVYFVWKIYHWSYKKVDGASDLSSWWYRRAPLLLDNPEGYWPIHNVDMYQQYFHVPTIQPQRQRVFATLSINLCSILHLLKLSYYWKCFYLSYFRPSKSV